MLFKNKFDQNFLLSVINDKSLSPSQRDLKLRIYTCHLIGSEPDLVMHGGGNTSVKTTSKNLFDESIDVIHVKGSGADLGDITDHGLPGLESAPLLKLKSLSKLSDKNMVNAQRQCLLDTSSPNPSIETLLHAFLPHKYIDHTHSTPFLALANLANATEVTKKVFGDVVGIVPYVMPGFNLAKTAYEVFKKNKNIEGLLLLNHGHFTFGNTADESYTRLIDQTNKIAHYLGVTSNTNVGNKGRIDPELLTQIRNLYVNSSEAEHRHTPIFDVRSSNEILGRLSLENIENLANKGVASPDHIIRIKSKPLFLSTQTLISGQKAIRSKFDSFTGNYNEYFKRNNSKEHPKKTKLDPRPCHVWVQGHGIIGIGVDQKSASAVADLSEQNLFVRAIGEANGGFFPIKEKDEFDIEYWALEQAKLAKNIRARLTGKIILITGAAGTIGSATAQAFKDEGAELFLIDIDGEKLNKVSKTLKCKFLTIDLCSKNAAEVCVKKCIEAYGGLDILISNAGIAVTGNMHEISDSEFERSFEMNFEVHRKLSQAGANAFINQGIGGQILFNISKQAVNPGKSFGAYGIPKAATMFLMKQLAVELGEYKIRVNGINADKIRSGILTKQMIKARSSSRKLSEEQYMKGNLLQTEVYAKDVAQAFVSLALLEKSTGTIISVDGGNIEASLR